MLLDYRVAQAEDDIVELQEEHVTKEVSDLKFKSITKDINHTKESIERIEEAQKELKDEILDAIKELHQ